MDDEWGTDRDKKVEPRYAAFVVGGSGILGLVAAFYMYADASERGEEFLQDSVWYIAFGALLAIVSLAIALYLLLKSKKAE